MKILYIDVSSDGHHIIYLSALIRNKENECVVCLPEKAENLKCKQILLPAAIGRSRSLSAYFRWIKRAAEIAREEKADAVHFLYGDYLYRYFGMGLSLFGNCKKIVTFHFVDEGLLHRISEKTISAAVSNIVVHSEYLKNALNRMGIRNAVHIEYPYFNHIVKSREESLKHFGLKENAPVILCLGSTRFDKGLDILLKAMGQVTRPFQLLIAGEADCFDETFISENSTAFSDSVTVCLHFLSDEELSLAIGASDIIALPYRRLFNGASGPLGEGVAQNKCIIGPNHGNLGHTIEENHLGYTFETENILSLTSVLNEALNKPFETDEKYNEYRESLDVSLFCRTYDELYKKLK